MSLRRQIARGLRVILHRKSADREIADELRHYLDESIAALTAAGLTPADARRAAQLELGNLTALHEQVRAYGWENALGTFLSDLRYTLRRLRQKPGFATACLLTLALGIGATTAIFSVMEGVLWKPLPYPDAARIVALRHTAPGIHIDDLNMAGSLYFTYREENRVFQDVAMWRYDTVTITGLAQPEEVPALVVAHRFLPVLGVLPAMGRAFTPADDDPQSQRTVILTDGYWRSRLGADPSVLGRRIVMDGEARQVVGVMPPSFQFLDRPVSLLFPFRMRRADIRLISFCCEGIARLKPGITLAQANADVARMLSIAPAKFAVNPGFSAHIWAESRIAPRIRPLKDVLVGSLGKMLWVLMGTVGIVLLIACANAANLLLVRADSRRHELAIRAALGAARGRIARELLLESTLLGLAGGALGLALAYAALHLLAASGLANLPRLHDIAIDPIVVAFALAVSLASGLLFGLIPVFKYARPQLSEALRGAGRSQSQSRERHRARNLLVVVQVALALVLLIASGLMIRTFQALHHVDPGFSHQQPMETLRLSIPESPGDAPVTAIRTEEEILRQIQSIPGVSAAAIISDLPMEGGTNDPVYADRQNAQPGAVPPIRRYKFVSPGYFATTGARLLAGREFTWAETYNAAPLAVISENMAREFWRDPHSAIGQRIRPTLQDDWREIVGVVADLHDDGLDQKAPGIVYWPLLRKNFESAPVDVSRGIGIIVRTPRAGTMALLADLQKAVAAVNPALPVAAVQTMASIYGRSLARTAFALVLLAIAGAMALLLGVIGIYGVIAYSVAQRTREIGIRLALGATLREVTIVFVRHGLVLSAIGAACGLAAALALTRLMQSLLYNVGTADPLTYAGVSLLLILAATLASYLPARKAAKVDPSEALRAD